MTTRLTGLGVWLGVMALGCGQCGAPSSTTPQSSLRGIVQRADGQPLAGVAVISSTASATTDSTGRYTLRASPGTTVVRFTAPGYVDVVKSVSVVSAVPTMTHVTLLTSAPAVPLDAATGGTVQGSGGASIKAPAHAFVDRDGQAVDTINVRVTRVDPTTAAVRQGVSGDFTARSGSSTTMLESAGMMDIDVRSNGQRARLATGKQLEVRLPVAEGETSPPATMELWSFDDSTGRWVSEGTATLDASSRTYVATIGHMSMWNVDKPYLATCVAGRVVDESNAPLPGAHVRSDGVDYLGSTETTTDGQGVFRLAVRKSSSVDIVAQHQLGGGESRRVASGPDSTTVPPTSTDSCLDGGVYKVVKDVFTTESGTVSCDSINVSPTGCLAEFAAMTQCYQPAGACEMTVDSSGSAVTTYASGSSFRIGLSEGSQMATAYYGTDGRLCFQSETTISGLSVTLTYKAPDGGAYGLDLSGAATVVCPDGSRISLQSDQMKAMQACAPQSSTDSSGAQCSVKFPGSCTSGSDCSGPAQVCCQFSGSSFCTEATSCRAVDGGILP